MGCIGTYCQISHIGIGLSDRWVNRRVYLLPVFLSFNDKCTYYAGLPIECTYDNYGGFIDAKYDKNVEHFERLYGLYIGHLINICTKYDYEGLNPFEIDILGDVTEKDYDNMTIECLEDLNHLRFMCVRKDVYDFFAQFNIKVSNDFDNYNIKDNSAKLNYCYDYETNPELKEDFEKYYRFLGACEHLNYRSKLYTKLNSFVQSVDNSLLSKVFIEFAKICDLRN